MPVAKTLSLRNQVKNPGGRQPFNNTSWDVDRGSGTNREKRRTKFIPQFEEFEGRFTPSAPSVLSISRMMPLPQFTTATSVVYAVTFDQPVSGVDASDFKVEADATLKFSPTVAVGGSDAMYTVT